jgi:hypothetical protein
VADADENVKPPATWRITARTLAKPTGSHHSCAATIEAGDRKNVATVARGKLPASLNLRSYQLTPTIKSAAEQSYKWGQLGGVRSIMASRRCRNIRLALVACLSAGVISSAFAITPDDPGPAAIQFALDSGQDVKSISPWIYGSNSSNITNRTFDRSGGNRMTGYNWENNASNAGSDWYHHSDYGLVNNQSNAPPGSAVSGMILGAAANGRASLVTVPMAGYVAADGNGTVDETEIAPSPRWKKVEAKKSTIYPGSHLSTNPDKTDGYVFTDEFVHWAEDFKEPDQPVWYSLDNEPALWGEALPAGWQSGVEPNPCCNPANGTNPSPGGRTHPTIHPYAPTYNEMRDKTIAHASAIKDVNPEALVFGGVGYGYAEFNSLQGALSGTSPSHPGGDQGGELHYYERLLNDVRAEETAQGRTLMDVLDLHWYPEARGLDNGGVSRRVTFDANPTDPGVVAARVQSPRSLWDPDYTETSWITGCCSDGPIKLLKHVQRDVADFKPGTKIAITEYNYGAGSHYSGGIAQADFLGILGREGVFAANWWDLGNGSSYVNSAFNLYVNYDGAGSGFGDSSIDADTSNIANSAVYASVDSSDPNRMVVVAINRTESDQTTGVAVTHDRVFDHAEVHRFTNGSANITHAADIELDLLNAFQYTMPAWSVTTLVLISDGLAGDFNRDGTVSAADYTVWRNSLGQAGNTAADANEDNVVDLDDYAMWKANFGRSETAGAGGVTAVPEPPACLLTFLAAFGLVVGRIRRGESRLVKSDFSACVHRNQRAGHTLQSTQPEKISLTKH